MSAPRIDLLNSQQNQIINGNFDFFQRNTTVTGLAAASTTYMADRFLLRMAGTTAIYRMDRSTDVPTYAQSSFQSAYSLAVQCTTADASLGAGDQVSIEYRMEGFDYASIAGGASFRLQFWAKSVKAGTYCVSMINSAGDRFYVKEYVLAANTWTKVTMDLTSDSAGTWLLDNGRGLLIRWALMSGSSSQGAANAWTNGSAYSTSNQVNFSDSTSNIFYLSQVMLVAGSYPSATSLTFKRAGRTIGDELHMCQRYCVPAGQLVPSPGIDVAANTISFFSSLPVAMRTNCIWIENGDIYATDYGISNISGVTQTGFVVTSITGTTLRGRVLGTKTAHGLSTGVSIGFGARSYFEAEL